jgi:hypothetical protein
MFSPAWMTSSSMPVFFSREFESCSTCLALTFAAPPVDLITAAVCAEAFCACSSSSQAECVASPRPTRPTPTPVPIAIAEALPIPRSPCSSLLPEACARPNARSSERLSPMISTSTRRAV